MPNTLFTSTILRWYAAHRRDLPWRGIGDAYGIWVSEVILQQTRIEQGRDYWLRFMERFPTVEALAAADEDEVLRLWQGLGYYSRARNMHAAAKTIVAMGRFPDNFAELKQLKGVGEYTAAAVASMAFGEPVAAVDGNVLRVMARYFGIDADIASTQGRRLIGTLAQDQVPAGAAGDFNSALMDFGSLQCTPSTPDCGVCPLAETCAAWRQGRVASLPVKINKVKVKTRRMACVYVRHGGKIALRKRPAGDIWQGLWQPVVVEDASAEALASVVGCAPRLLKTGVKHVLTHRVILADFYLAEPASQPPLAAEGYVWINENERGNFAVPRLFEMLFDLIPV